MVKNMWKKEYIYGRCYYLDKETVERWVYDGDPDSLDFMEDEARKVEKELGLPSGYINHAEIADWDDEYDPPSVCINFYHVEEKGEGEGQ